MISSDSVTPQRRDGADTAAALLARMAGITVLCVGDVMLDESVACQRGRLSPEAPVLVFGEGAKTHCAGGAGNVAVNVASLGARAELVGVISQDPEGTRLSQILAGAGVDLQLAMAKGGYLPTTRKTRFVAGGQQLLRVDRDGLLAPGDPLVAKLVRHILRKAPPPGAILVSDYAKGVVCPAVIAACHDLAARTGALVLVDPKGNDWARYGPVDLVKPNAAELAGLTGLPTGDDAEVEAALAAALAQCEARAIVVTRAEQGASLARRGCPVVHVPALPVEVADVCGAGDTNMAALGAALAAGADPVSAVRLAQLASAQVVQKHGTAVVDRDDLLAAGVSRSRQRSLGKVMTRQAAAAQAAAWREAGLVVGFTNGCFDLVHPGHVQTLEAAREQCDRLIVALNSNASVRRLKGSSRPVVPEQDRARVLAGMAAVDAVVLFEEDTPQRLIETLCPAVLVKGGDYDPATLVGADFVRAMGGRVVVTPIVTGRSTTQLVDSLGARR